MEKGLRMDKYFEVVAKKNMRDIETLTNRVKGPVENSDHKML